jgi:hypothetical protein
MALGYPYVVYGSVDDGSSGLKNAKIIITNNDTSDTLYTYTLDEGFYQIDIQSIVNIGNSITVSTSYKNTTDSSNFTIVSGVFWNKIDFSLTIVVTPKGDLEIRFGNLGESEKIICYCTKWDTSNYTYIVETFIRKEESILLRNNIVPGCVKELYRILESPFYVDSTWSDSNTIKIIPLGHMDDMRNEVTGFVKNYSEHVINNEFIGIKMEINFND